jgi:predicted nucleic acid-binding protein
MDHADATLVVLAEELGTNLVLTTDRRDFSVYRIEGRRKFKVKPELPSRGKRAGR